MPRRDDIIIVAPRGEKKTCFKTVVVEGNLRNYNKYKDKGWRVMDSGDGKIRFGKKVKCPRRT
jgi:hypothetical protein